MMSDIQWIFSGIGVEVLKIFISTLLGGIIGYKIGVKRKVVQMQFANKDVEQNQEAILEGKNNDNNTKVETNILQKQKAGDGAKQIQSGSIKY